MENESKSKTPMIIIGVIVVILVLGAGGFFLLNSSQETESTTTLPTTTTSTTTATNPTTSEDAALVISMTGKNFKFNPDEIRVKAGQKVKVELLVEDMMHDFVIDDLNVRTPIGKAGETVVVEFTPTTAGTYEFYCSVGNHKAQGMVGNLIVE